MKDVRPAVVGSQDIVLSAAIEDERIHDLREIGDGKKILGGQIGDQEVLAAVEAVLDRSNDIAVLRHDQLGQGVGMAKEPSRSV